MGAWTQAEQIRQTDPRWASVLMGRSSVSNIGDYGCLMASFGMLCGRTPAQINTLATANGGYQSAPGREAYAATFNVRQIIGSDQAPELLDAGTGEYPFSPYPLHLIKRLVAHLRMGHPAIIRVDAFPGRPGDQTHYVLGVAAYGPANAAHLAQIVINDPAYGDQVMLTARYGLTLERALVHAIYYRGEYVYG